MANNSQENLRTAALVILAACALVAGLYIGGEFVVPIALALILNVLFRPVVRWLERIRVPTTLGAAIVVLTLVALMTAGGYALATPIKNWFSNAPQYFSTAQQKLARLRKPVQKITEVANQAKSAVDGATTAPSTDPA